VRSVVDLPRSFVFSCHIPKSSGAHLARRIILNFLVGAFSARRRELPASVEFYYSDVQLRVAYRRTCSHFIFVHNTTLK
jgi:hypothetical protein